VIDPNFTRARPLYFNSIQLFIAASVVYLNIFDNNIICFDAQAFCNRNICSATVDSTQIDTHAIIIGSTNNRGSGASRTRLTGAYNFFATSIRLPSTSDGAWAHMFNNLYTRWKTAGFRVKRNAQGRSENNIYDGSLVTNSSWLGNALSSSDRMGNESVYDSGSLFLSGAFAQELNRNNIFIPPYPYSLRTANSSLRSDIEKNAGWRPASSFSF